MKKLSIVLSMLASVIAFPTFAQDVTQVELTQQQQTVYQQLQAESSNLNVSWNEQDAVPKWVRMTDLEINWRSADYTERAYQFLDEYGALYKIEGPRQVLQVQSQEQDTLGMTHVTLQQVYQGVPVFAGQLQFHFRADGTISSISGHYFPDQLAISSKPTITRQRAKQLAKQAVRNQLDLTQDQLNQLELQSTEPTLYYYNHGIFSKRNESTYLVWTFSVHSTKTLLDQVFYINAHTGSVVNTINNIQTAEAISTLVLADCTDEIGTLTYNETSTSDTDTIGSASSDAQAWEVTGYTDLVYDYYFDTFGRDSFDDTDPDDTTDGGGTMTSYTHLELDNSGTCEQTENAFWYPDEGVMYYGEDYITLDVTGHELTHAVVQYAVGTTDDDTLTYEDETGALNESYADVFGEFIELENGGTGDWQHREDYVDGANRDFEDPNMGVYDETLSYDATTNYGQPAHMDEKADVADPVCDEEIDNGCIHLNSGITNNALYLLIEGGTNSYSGDVVTGGVPREAVEQIYYRALTTHLGIASDFSTDYYATMQSCLDLYESDATTYPISYCEEVFDAFAAVGINTDNSYAWANISASATTGTAPVAITFDGADSVGINSTISSYAWNFGDGSTDSGGAVSHTFSNPGTFTVTLTVIDSTGYTSDASTTITVYASGTISSDTTWSAAYSPYVISGGVSISSGYTLTIEPGTVVKFLTTSSYLAVNGTVDATGTSTAPIVFTSYKDDTNGGDTNNDGTATTPAAGDWKYLQIAGSATGLFDYVTVQYGGSVNTNYPYASNPMFLIDDNATSVSIDNSTLQYSSSYTMQIDTGSTSTISNSTISNTASTDAIYLTAATSTLTGNTISSTSSYGVYVNGASPTIDGNTFTDSTVGVGIYGTSSAPTITDNVFDENYYGLYVGALSSTSPTTITGNTFTGNTRYGLYNGSTTTITAENNWWGDASGPYNATTNPTGIGDTVGSYVDFDPWTTTDPNADVTPPSDVTLGTTRKDVWAQTITLNWTNPTDSDFDHVQIDRTDLLAGTASTLSSTETGTSYSDTAPSYNTTYTYTLYTVDTTGNVSTGITTSNQRLRNPAPTNLVLTAGDTSIAATWNASSAPASSIGGYIVYYGTSRTALTNSVDVGNVTTATLTGLTNYTRYFVAVTAYSKGGHESAQSGIRATRPHP